MNGTFKNMMGLMALVAFGSACGDGATVSGHHRKARASGGLSLVSAGAGGESVASVAGDLNGDGILNGADARIVNQIAQGVRSPNKLELAAGDVNLDGKIDWADLYLLNKVLLGITTLPLDKGLVMGDVSSDGRVSSADVTLAMRIAGGTARATPAQVLRGDVTGDGIVSWTDAYLIQKASAGLVALPAAPGFLMGDINASGNLDAADATLARRFASGKQIPTPLQLASADVDGDGLATWADAYLIANGVVGLVQLPVANTFKWGDLDGDRAVTGADTILGKNIAAGIVQASAEQLLHGDVNGDGRIDMKDVRAIAQAVDKEITLPVAPAL